MTLRSHHGEQSLKNRFWGLGGVASLSEAGLGFLQRVCKGFYRGCAEAVGPRQHPRGKVTARASQVLERRGLRAADPWKTAAV
jgi:hypothetical protein